MAKAKPKSKAGGSTGDGLAGLEEFVKAHVERRLLRGGLDRDTCELCVKEIDTAAIEACAAESGWSPESQSESDGDRGADEKDVDPEDDLSRPPGMKASGASDFLKKLWENRDVIKKVVETLVSVFLLGNGATAGGDGSTVRASAQAE